MEKKREITIGSPVAVAGVKVIPVSELSSSYWHGQRGMAFSGIVQPISVVIVSPSVKRAFRISGEEITFDQLAGEIPGIMEKLGEV